MRRAIALSISAVAVVASVSCAGDDDLEATDPHALAYQEFTLTDDQRLQVQSKTYEPRAVILSRAAGTVVVGLDPGFCKPPIERLLIEDRDLVIELREFTLGPGEGCFDDLFPRGGLRVAVPEPDTVQRVVVRRVTPE